MKTKFTIRKVAAFIAIIFLSIVTEAQVVEMSKTIQKSFRAFPESNVQITNKYGNIHIVPNEADSVRFEIEIKVADKLVDKVTKVLNSIDIQFNNSPYYIIAKTVIGDYNNGVWSNISDIANTVFNGNTKVEINWIVYVPEKNEIKIENKYGSVYTTNHSGKFSIDLSNGDFQANNLTGDTKLKLAFGNAHLNKLTNATLDLNYMDFELGKANKLDMISKSSEIKLPFVNEMYINSRRDKCVIDTLNTIKGETNFSTIKFRKVNKDIMLNVVKYGNLTFDELATDLRYLNITSSYADLYLTIEKDFAANLDLTYNRKTVLVLPDSINSFPKNLTNPEMQEYKTSGKIGPEKPNATDVKLNVNQGSLTIGIR
ncbi:MAG: hypothetical protein PHD97_11430 [Bacteroidales bacterium]|nr:hypothetical protein [Bacteroidales bacterium]